MNLRSHLLLFCWNILAFVGLHAQTSTLPMDTKQNDSLALFQLPYQLTAPDETFELPGRLVEISGLTMSSSKEQLYAVQDEEGLVFQINKTDGKVLKETKFWKNGDYEGIEVVGDRLYVVKSTGTIYEISDFGTEEQKVVKYNTFLTRENDVEGLGYDPKQNALLIACKGIPATGESFEKARLKKAIYSFDLAKKELKTKPCFVISLETIHRFLKTTSLEKNVEKLISFFQPNQNLTFNPSALAVHPISSNIYLLSSSKKIIIVLNPDGQIIHISRLKKKVHRQPEGLAFDDDGTLYLANEGKTGKACIHRFSLQRPLEH